MVRNSVEETMNGKLPENLRRYPIADFTSALGDFLLANGDEGRELVRQIIDDKAVAENVEAHPDSPKVLEHLAGISKKLHAALPKVAGKPAPLGFAAA